MVNHGNAPFLECSSKGEKCLSAFYARIRSRGNASIEDLYQAAKVFDDGSTGLGWRSAKGRKATNMAEVRELYSTLWDEYINENRMLIALILQAPGLSDMFGSQGSVCQATELWRIRGEVMAMMDADSQATQPGELNRSQKDALLSFRDLHGEAWKNTLMKCWKRCVYPMNPYPRMSIDHIDGLQQILKAFGPQWLQLNGNAVTDERRLEIQAENMTKQPDAGALAPTPGCRNEVIGLRDSKNDDQVQFDF